MPLRELLPVTCGPGRFLPDGARPLDIALVCAAHCHHCRLAAGRRSTWCFAWVRTSPPHESYPIHPPCFPVQHGWQFKGCGTCVSMPQGGDPSNARACATACESAVFRARLLACV